VEREKIKSILRNIHESLKWTWQLIMGFAFVSVVKEYFSILHTTYEKGDMIYINLLFFLFIITFIRFLFGNNRYLDERYVEFLYKIKDLESEEKNKYIKERTQKLSGKRRFYDIIMLLCTGIIFVILAKSLSQDKALFVKYFILLMVINIFFLSISVLWNIYIEVGHKKSLGNNLHQIIFSLFDYEKFPIIWILNNFFCVILFYCLRFRFQSNEYLIFIVIFYLNSFIDLFATWNLYFPKIDILEEE